ncbi:MAG: MarR family winged helix-turn-helix transcriptional regulator [Frankia sp.]
MSDREPANESGPPSAAQGESASPSAAEGGSAPPRATGGASAALAFLLAQVGGLAAMRFAERLAPLGLTPAQAGLLRAVGTEPGRSQQALSAQLGLLPSRLVVLVDELQREGLMERRRNPDDRRHYELHLTPAGAERLRAIGAVAQAHGEDYLAPLSDEDRATLTDLLGRLATSHELTPQIHPGYRAIGPGRPPAARSA